MAPLAHPNRVALYSVSDMSNVQTLAESFLADLDELSDDEPAEEEEEEAEAAHEDGDDDQVTAAQRTAPPLEIKGTPLRVHLHAPMQMDVVKSLSLDDLTCMHAADSLPTCDPACNHADGWPSAPTKPPSCVAMHASTHLCVAMHT